MAPRANWKGTLAIGEFTCPVALYTAVSTSDRVAFHLLNRKSGGRVHREFVDGATGKPVASENQVKGYALEGDRFVVLQPEEIAAAIPDSDKVLRVEAFVPLDGFDDAFLDRGYYLGLADEAGAEAYALLREALADGGAGALARTVLFRRLRTLLVTATEDGGLIATTLHFDYEVRSAAEAFADIPAKKLDGEMLELAAHIIQSKRGTFDPADFHDRYDAALAELVRAKQQGKALPKAAPPPEAKVVDLLQALRESAGTKPKAPSRKAAAKPARRKTG